MFIPIAFIFFVGSSYLSMSGLVLVILHVHVVTSSILCKAVFPLLSMTSILFQARTTLERRLVMSGFIEAEVVELGKLLPGEDAQFLTVWNA